MVDSSKFSRDAKQLMWESRTWAAGTEFGVLMSRDQAGCVEAVKKCRAQRDGLSSPEIASAIFCSLRELSLSCHNQSSKRLVKKH